MMKQMITLTALTVALAAAGCAPAEKSTTETTTTTTTSTVQANDSDKAFIDGMVPHHQMAVMMADDALTKANRAELKTFAQQVKADQSKEIAQMKDWRKQWFGSDETPMMPHGGMKTMAAGPGYDKMWAEEMIAHHQDAIAMAEKDMAAAARPETKALAQQIIDAQKKEQETLRTWIAAWSK